MGAAGGPTVPSGLSTEALAAWWPQVQAWAQALGFSQIGVADVDLAAAEVSLLDEMPDVYVCGPPPMVDAAYVALGAAGVPEDQIHAERFG